MALSNAAFALAVKVAILVASSGTRAPYNNWFLVSGRSNQMLGFASGLVRDEFAVRLQLFSTGGKVSVGPFPPGLVP